MKSQDHAALRALEPVRSRRDATDRVAHAYGNLFHQAGGRQIEILAKSYSGSSVCVGLYASPPYELRVPGMSGSRLSVSLTPSQLSGRFDSGRWTHHSLRRHGLFLIPEGTETQWRKESPGRHVNVFFRAAAFAHGELDADLAEFGRLPLENVFVPGATAVIQDLVTELESPTRFSAEAADSLARLLLIRTARSTAHRLRAGPSLSRHDESRLREYVLAHLSERILVADLALAIGLSPTRFAHVFSASTGRSPHKFVVGLRLEMAQDLLVHSRLGLAEIASTCGFSSQQHMTATMQRQVGTSPGRLRRLRASPLPEQS